MPSTEIQVPVRVRLYPEYGSAHPWTCPAGVAIQLKRKGIGASKISPKNLVTGHGGVTEPAQLPVGTYQINITDPRFALWEAADLTVSPPPESAEVVMVTVSGAETEEAEEEVLAIAEAVAEAELAEEVASDAGHVLDVPLFPQGGRRLVVIRLVTEDGDHVAAGTVTIAATDGTSFDQSFGPCPDGYIYAVAPKVPVTLSFASAEVDGPRYCPQAFLVPYTVATVPEVKALEFIYWRQITISARPTITVGGAQAPLTGTTMTVEYQEASGQAGGTSRTKTLAAGDDEISFAYAFPGYYTVTVTAPSTWGNLPIQPGPALPGQQLFAGDSWEVPAEFTLAPTQDITIQVQTPLNQPLAGDLDFEVSYGTGSVPVHVTAGAKQGTATVPCDGALTVTLTSGAATLQGNLPLTMSTPGQEVTPGTNTVVLDYEYSIAINAIDQRGQPVTGAVIDVLDQRQAPAGTGITDQQGTAVVGVATGGPYYLAERSVAGEPMTLTPVTVASKVLATMMLSAGRGAAAGREALTELGAYPVLTEEITTTGVPAPLAGGSGGGGPGAGYGQTVEQVMRDVLGWRPSGDVAGFQAALSGTFQLREVEGHTEWTWQQRGYAVQADMGALTGAQASIYARAKSALDQVLPLLAGLTTLNPAAYPPQDLEAIRTIVTAELNELVSELAWEGGPRIQRVDELFVLLLGENHRSFSLDPDRVEGQLGILRDRFALTEDQIDTVDEERVVTNFRVIVEQVLALQASWFKDRQLLSGVNGRTSLGTLLIWLSRGLEAVCESVGDLAFALDSVYVDAAQRQVIELRFAGVKVELPQLPLTTRTGSTRTMTYTFGPHEPPILLSDLLDWITRASRDEGPRIVQDAGKDGVLAFVPVLDKLRILVHATRKAARTGVALPDGMRTPRVGRALQVLAAQLDEAANYARLARREPAPQITQVSPIWDLKADGKPIILTLTGFNFGKSDSAVLIAENREDLADMPAHPIDVAPPNKATATFMNPAMLRNTAGTTWLVALVNEYGTQSNQVEAVHVSHSLT